MVRDECRWFSVWLKSQCYQSYALAETLNPHFSCWWCFENWKSKKQNCETLEKWRKFRGFRNFSSFLPPTCTLQHHGKSLCLSIIYDKFRKNESKTHTYIHEIENWNPFSHSLQTSIFSSAFYSKRGILFFHEGNFSLTFGQIQIT